MKVSIAKHDFNLIWDGVYKKALADYPNISNWEIKQLILFSEYEKANGRTVVFECEVQRILDKINNALKNKARYLKEPRPAKIRECIACRHKGCLTDFVCHTASVEDALSILRDGSIFSAVGARRFPGDILCLDPRNAAKDPADFFEYVMFSWGNCQAGDRLVMERMLGRAPDSKDLSKDFKPGIRFYFKHDDLIHHPGAVFDGYHPLKIKDELKLDEYLFAVVVPAEYRDSFEPFMLTDIMDKLYVVDNDSLDIWEWSEKVYEFIEGLQRDRKHVSLSRVRR